MVSKSEERQENKEGQWMKQNCFWGNQNRRPFPFWEQLLQLNILPHLLLSTGTFWLPFAYKSYSYWLKLANLGCKTVIWALIVEIFRETHVKYVQNKILQPSFTSFCYSRHILPLKCVLISIEEPSRWVSCCGSRNQWLWSHANKQQHLPH